MSERGPFDRPTDEPLRPEPPTEPASEPAHVLQGLRSRFPRVRFAAVFVRGRRGALRTAIRERGWTLPVAHELDGAVAGVYAVAACPTITFARRGGEVRSTSLAFLDERALVDRLRAVGG